MKIDFEEIKELLRDGNLADVSRETGIAYRTLQDWKLENNKWLQQAEDRLTKIQNYINMEEVKMKVMSKEDLRSVDMEYRGQVIELVDFLESNTMDEEFELLLNKLNELGFETEDLYPEYRGGVEMVGITSLDNVFRGEDGDFEVLFANFKDGKCVGVYWGA